MEGFHGGGAVPEAKYRGKALAQVGYGAVPGAAGTLAALSHKGQLPQGVDDPVPVQRPGRGEGSVKAVQRQIQKPFPFLLILQRICNDGDDSAPGFQTGFLRRLVCTFGIAGDQRIALPGCLPAHFLSKCQILGFNGAAAYQSHRRGVQKGNIPLGPQAAGTLQPQSLSEKQGIPGAYPGDGGAAMHLCLF